MRAIGLSFAILATGAAWPAVAAVTVYQGNGNLAAFNAAVGSPPITLAFEDAPIYNTNLAGQTLSGVTFASPSGNTLQVVNAADTFSSAGFGNATNVLPATSGRRIVSPGGVELVPGPAVAQRDGLDLTFATPLSAFGLDVLFQSLDGASFASFTAYDASGDILVLLPLTIPGNTAGAPGGAFFIGFVSDSPSTNIKRIVFNDLDDDAANPDANLGYDSFRFTMAGAVPEPATWGSLILGFGLVGGALRRRVTRVSFG